MTLRSEDAHRFVDTDLEWLGKVKPESTKDAGEGNPNHDPKTGEFSSGEGGGSGSGNETAWGVTLKYNKGKVQPKTPGIHVETHKSGSNTYPKVIHSSSGKIIEKFNTAPLQGGLKQFAASVDKHLGGVDWNRSVDELSKDAEKIKSATSNLRTEINERNHYKAYG
jgi:hypothetical protein